MSSTSCNNYLLWYYSPIDVIYAWEQDHLPECHHLQTSPNLFIPGNQPGCLPQLAGLYLALQCAHVDKKEPHCKIILPNKCNSNKPTFNFDYNAEKLGLRDVLCFMAYSESFILPTSKTTQGARVVILGRS